MTIEEIPADELTVMTEPFHRAFNVYGCNPACHCCWEPIKVGTEFKLAPVEDAEQISTNYLDRFQDVIDNFDDHKVSREVMLCANCTPEKYKKKQITDLKKRKKRAETQLSPSQWGCFRVNGKIIHQS
jgi:hypothetical protein